MAASNQPITDSKGAGLTTPEITALKSTFGPNEFSAGQPPRFLQMIWTIIREPMFLILILACMLYFILGEVSEGLLMLVSVLLVAAISFYQEFRSTHALDALRAYTQPKVVVQRDGRQQIILSRDPVPGDWMMLEEGDMIPADARIVRANDLTINESILTGEAAPVEKNRENGGGLLFQGAIINSGSCNARVTATGNRTELGKLGKYIHSIL